MPPASGLRQFLEVRTRDELVELADFCEISLSQRRSVEPILGDMWKKKGRLRVRLVDYLAKLARDDLKEICRKLGLETSGKEKAPIQDRILAFVGFAETHNGEDEADVEVEPQLKSSAVRASRPKIFIVHGHDLAMRKDVEFFLSKAGIDAVVMANEPNSGKTIIEKLEAYIKPDVCPRAIVLFSPDDVGHIASKESEKQARARQNVLFEFGMVVGKLGRENVILLHRGGVEFPSDIQGLVWIRYEHDDHGAKLNLAKELKSMGYPIDLNKIFHG